MATSKRPQFANLCIPQNRFLHREWYSQQIFIFAIYTVLDKKRGVKMSEVYVVQSKVKEYIKTKSGMSCSANVMEALTEVVKTELDRAMENAKQDKRKTVMDRDLNQS